MLQTICSYKDYDYTESCGEHASMFRIPLLSLNDSLMSESSPTCCITKQQKTYMCIVTCFFFGQKYPKTEIVHLPIEHHACAL